MFAMFLFDMDWKAELLKRLDAIGEKLGVAANHLWAVLVRQGVAVGIEDCLIGLVWLGLWIAALAISAKIRAYGRKEDDGDFIFGGYTALAIGQLLLIGAGTYLFSGIVELYNPEFYALQQILSTLK